MRKKKILSMALSFCIMMSVVSQSGMIVFAEEDSTSKMVNTTDFSYGTYEFVETNKSDIHIISTNDTVNIDLNDYLECPSGETEKNFNFTLSSGIKLPSGLTLDSNGKVTGKALETGIYAVSFDVTNGLSTMSLHEDPSNNSAILWLLFYIMNGDGTENVPYTISNIDELEIFQDLVNYGNDTTGMYFKLTEDINLDGNEKKQWTPIGTYNKTFKGSFDGAGHKISGLYINDESSDYLGLFGANHGTIKNIGVSGEINGNNNVGGVCGENEGIILNCYSECSLKGNWFVGGVCGGNYVTVENSYNIGTVIGSELTGGVCGLNESGGTVKNSYNVGAVSGTGDYIGGVCGSNNDEIINCYYLKSDIVNGNVFGIGGTTEDTLGVAESKSTSEFESGNIAHILQSHQDENQVWGQTLTGTIDQYPVLTNDSEKAVHKITFVTSENPVDNPYAVKYANTAGIGELPIPPVTTDENKVFSRWVKTNSVDGDEFTAKTVINDDITVYAVSEVKYGENVDVEKTITLTSGDVGVTQDLSEYTVIAGSDKSAGKFDYEILSGNTDLKATVDGDILTIPNNAPENASGYILRIKATKKVPELSLMSDGALGIEPIEFDVKVVVNKSSDFAVEMSAPALVNGKLSSINLKVNKPLSNVTVFAAIYDDKQMLTDLVAIPVDMSGTDGYKEVSIEDANHPDGISVLDNDEIKVFAWNVMISNGAMDPLSKPLTVEK